MYHSRSLKKTLTTALQAVENHPHHDLNLGYRQAIWAVFDFFEASERHQNIGHFKRIKLAIMTAHKVLPLWESKFSNDKLPHETLKVAETVLIGEYHFETTEKYLQQAWNNIENLASEPNFQDDCTQRAIAAGTSAVKAVSTALYDESFDVNNINYQNSDEDLDSFQVDSSFWAATSYAGPIWDSSASEPKKRLEFWHWWLKEAVPMAFSFKV